MCNRVSNGLVHSLARCGTIRHGVALALQGGPFNLQVLLGIGLVATAQSVLRGLRQLVSHATVRGIEDMLISWHRHLDSVFGFGTLVVMLEVTCVAGLVAGRMVR